MFVHFFTVFRSEYLYYELLALVDKEWENQLSTLEQNIDKLTDEDELDWNELTIWNIPDEYPQIILYYNIHTSNYLNQHINTYHK